MVVVSIFRWLLNLCWKEKMKIYRYEADTAFSKTLAADYQHRPWADPGFEVRGGANGLENFENRDDYIFIVYIYLKYDILRYISKFSTIFIS